MNEKYTVCRVMLGIYGHLDSSHRKCLNLIKGLPLKSVQHPPNEMNCFIECALCFDLSFFFVFFSFQICSRGIFNEVENGHVFKNMHYKCENGIALRLFNVQQYSFFSIFFSFYPNAHFFSVAHWYLRPKIHRKRAIS